MNKKVLIIVALVAIVAISAYIMYFKKSKEVDLLFLDALSSAPKTSDGCLDLTGTIYQAEGQAELWYIEGLERFRAIDIYSSNPMWNCFGATWEEAKLKVATYAKIVSADTLQSFIQR